MTRQESIQTLKERLDDLLERRKRLVNMWLVFIVFLVGSFVLPRLAVRFFGTYAWFVVLIAAAAVLGYVGLRLLAGTIYNIREARQLRAAIRKQEKEQQKKRKRTAANKRSYWRRRKNQPEDDAEEKDETEEPAYTIGPDGELVEVDAAESRGKSDRHA